MQLVVSLVSDFFTVSRSTRFDQSSRKIKLDKSIQLTDETWQLH